MDHKHEMSWMSDWMKIVCKILIALLYVALCIVPLALIYWGYVRFVSKKRIFPSR
jgi:hypothetical protein